MTKSVDYWRYGDTSFRQKQQVISYLTILEEIICNNGIEKQNIFNELVKIGLKKKNSKRKSKDTNLILKTLKWLDLIAEKDDFVFLSNLGKDIIINSTTNNKLLEILEYFEIDLKMFKMLNILLNDYLSSNSKRKKEYSNFDIIPFRAIFKFGRKTITKEEFKKFLRWKNFDLLINESKSNEKKELIFKKPSPDHEYIKKFYNEKNVYKKLEIIENALYKTKNVTLLIFKKLIKKLLNINKQENINYKKLLNEKKILIIDALIINESKINLWIDEIKLDKNLDEFSDLNIRWFRDFKILQSTGTDYKINEKYFTIVELANRLNLNFYSNNKISLIDNIELLHSIIINQHDFNKNISFDKKIASLENTQEFLKNFENDDKYYEWINKEINASFKGIRKHVLFEYFSCLKIWYLFDGENKEHFFSQSRTIFDQEGFPITHAPGGGGDALFTYDDFKYLIEPTILERIDDLLENERNQIKKHLLKIKWDTNKKCVLNVIPNLKNVDLKIIAREYSRDYCEFPEDPQRSYLLLIPLRANALINLESKDDLLKLISNVKNAFLTDSNFDSLIGII